MSLLFRTILPKLLEPKKFKVTTITRLFDSITEPAKNPIEVNLKPTIIPDNLSQWTGEDFDVASEPIIYQREYYDSYRFHIEPRQAWIENIDTIKEKKLGLASLHPEIFGAQPRIEMITRNVRWQRYYRWIGYEHTKRRHEIELRSRKPWPQKGTGRSRHSCKKTAIWGNVKPHGPREYKTHFFMLDFYSRIMGLTSCLSIKQAQDDLHIIPDLEIPTDQPEYIETLIQERNWGPSVLFVDNNDVISQNMAIATNNIYHVNVMPVYGLNVYSMLKHDTLVLTLDALQLIEDKLVFHLNRLDSMKKMKKFRPNQQ